MRWLLPLVTLVSACDAPCDLEQLPACPDCGPGEIRGGVSGPIDDVIDKPPVAAPVTGGIGCVFCEELHRFDTGGTEVGTVGIDDPYWAAVAPDGTIYVLKSYQPPRGSDGELPLGAWRVLAYESDGHERWHVDLESYDHPSGLSADDAGPYVARRIGTQPRITAYDAASGGERWTDTGDLAVPDGAGGVLVFSEKVSGLDLSTLSMVSFDAAHAERWRRTLTARGGSSTSPSSIEVSDAHITADGLAIVGRFTGSSLDLDGVTLSTPLDLYVGFVASLDAQGAPRWGHAFGRGTYLADLSVTTAGPSVAVGARYVGEGGDLGLPATGNASLGDNGFLAAFDAQGPLRVHSFSGEGFQGIRSIVDGGDGSVWATLDTRGGFTLGNELHAGDDSPRRYLINVVP